MNSIFHALILTDLDNTLYNWLDYFAPSFRAMVHALCKKIGISEEALIEDFKRIYREKRFIEYSFSVQELGICRGRSKEEIGNLIRVAKGAFSRVRRKRLQLYPGVEETLLWAHKKKIPVIGVTNTSVFQGERRLCRLRIDGLFYGLAGWEGHDVPEEYEEKEYSSKILRKWFLRFDELKPSAKGYLRILKELKVPPKVVYIVGDSLERDVVPALQIGANAIWAKYGQEVEPKNFQTLCLITYRDQEKNSNMYEKAPTIPTVTINNFGELQQIIKLPPGFLPGFN